MKSKSRISERLFINPYSAIDIVECPRDAMQGWPHFIPTDKKVEYLNALLSVGFHTIDFGSFVSSKAIPQMADTKVVIQQLNLSDTKSKLLAIVANVRGAEEACTYEAINVLGFPFSISPSFQMRNTNSTIEESLQRVETILELCKRNKKELVIYLSMGFGNPYGDEYNEEILLHWANEMVNRGIKIISLADTVGLATTEEINFALKTLIPKYPEVNFGVHLHSTKGNIQQKLKAALDAGCKRFDGALKGIGGCPMAQNDLVGNMDTEKMIDYFEEEKYTLNLDKLALKKAHLLAESIFI
ncbi:hydroxymethylglutaryl-CoA lyase [Arachidicoccus soli]|uniref:Hydroxymethylglutaryl-CoA lyase n=1 Tax=Arachidicoccus soli TaxID=2341117 RepID=A0A386HP88_9BACT|nr:hydroxymethylglutaryl-CoA lyase [Arachidicoccus soli]AYD47251.1 hydroxymethylglutaryl-CoA lyase [Arachidicoccus soli]